MPRIAMVAALEREVRPLVKRWRISEKQHSGRNFRFFETEEAVLVCGGIGAEAARRAAEALIVLYRPAIVYSVGYAGSLDPAIGIGQLMRPARVVDVRDGSTVPMAAGEGVLVTTDSVASPAQKRTLRESFQAQIVDMEAAAVGRAAEARGVEFGVIKAVSDAFDFELPASGSFVDSEGRFRETQFALFVSLRPWLWRRAMELARNSRTATQALCGALQELINTKS
ncbi:MAG TPA: phosphorylase [Candidatus Sulfotelmatobacter sp.]|nr:phosphorylase [Candidatus Sulfotelmatobacter sp.]